MQILEIVDGDTAIINDVAYHTGDIVKCDKYNGCLCYGGDGIYFRPSRADAEKIQHHEK